MQLEFLSVTVCNHPSVFGKCSMYFHYMEVHSEVDEMHDFLIHIGLQEEVRNPFETHSKVDEGM